jgi:DNA-binding response OmpR family regulator
VSYAEMAMALYGAEGEWDEQEARQSLSTHLWRLRTKLGDAPDGRPYIANVRGRGYKFVRA